MALTPSTMLSLGTMSPDFKLPDTNGKIVSAADFKDAPALLVIFMCNHCPYVVHIRAGLAQLARDYAPKHVAIVGINSNRKLVYRGQFDGSRPGNGIPVTGKDLRAALDAVLVGQPVSPSQKASIGCNIKWKSGNEPDYF
jgi:thiol-disulfide isomerase/thioredoxin